MPRRESPPEVREAWSHFLEVGFRRAVLRLRESPHHNGQRTGTRYDHWECKPLCDPAALEAYTEDPAEGRASERAPAELYDVDHDPLFPGVKPRVIDFREEVKRARAEKGPVGSLVGLGGAE